MNKQQLQKKQEELDNEILKCPNCGGEVKWGWIKEWGVCKYCYDKNKAEKWDTAPRI